MAELLHFPQSFPVEALRILAPIVRDRRIDDRVAAGEAALTLQGYAMGQVLGHGPAGTARAPGIEAAPAPGHESLKFSGKPSQREAEEALQQLESAPAPEGAAAMPGGGLLAGSAMVLVRHVLAILLKSQLGGE